MAGVAGAVPARYDSATCFRLAGININQDDDPWWVPTILSWLSMYKSLMEAYGETGSGFRKTVEMVMEYGKPYRETNTKTGATKDVYGANAVYAIYSDYVDAMKAASDK